MVFISTSSTSARRYPLSYVYSGYYVWGNGNLKYQDASGDWWPNSPYSSTHAHYLTIYNGTLLPQASYNKAGGFTLRCTDGLIRN